MIYLIALQKFFFVTLADRKINVAFFHLSVSLMAHRAVVFFGFKKKLP